MTKAIHKSTKASKEIINLRWLVKNRNEIQITAQRLFELLEDYKSIPGKYSLAFQDLIGASFSLWRGVFLAYDKESKPGMPYSHSKKFLRKMIGDNAINYPQDREFNEWTANYYVDNAGRILGDPLRGKSANFCQSFHPLWDSSLYFSLKGESIKCRWEYNHKILRDKINTFTKMLEKTLTASAS